MRRRILAAAVRFAAVEMLISAVGIFSGTSWGLVIAAALLLVIPVSIVCNLYLRSRIEFRLAMTAGSQKHSTSEILVSVRNRGILPAKRIFCILGVKNMLTGEERDRTLEFSAGAAEEATEAVLFQSDHCGGIAAEVRKAYITDWYGIIPLPIRCEVSGKTTISPETFSADFSVILGLSSDLDADEYRSDRPGNDASEIFSLREYREGDSLRSIHWKLSSKTDSLIVRENSDPVAHHLLVFWDKQPGSPEQMDAAAEVTASICRELTEKGLAYTLGCNRDGAAQYFNVRDEETMLEAIPQIVQYGGSEQELPLGAEDDWGRVIYIGTGVPVDLKAEAVLLICGEDEADNGEGIFFTPENYIQVFQKAVEL